MNKFIRRVGPEIQNSSDKPDNQDRDAKSASDDDQVMYCAPQAHVYTAPLKNGQPVTKFGGRGNLIKSGLK